MSINCVTESYIYVFSFFFLFSIWQFWSSIGSSDFCFFYFIIFMQIKLELDQEDKDPA